MFYRNELSFLCDFLQKCHVDAAPIDMDEYLERLDGEDVLTTNAFLKEHIRTLQPQTVCKLTDPFGLCYRFLLLPDTEFKTVFKVGPYLNSHIPTDKIWEIGEANGISPQKQRYLEEYYIGIPVIAAESPIWTAFNSFCERIWRSASCGNCRT